MESATLVEDEFTVFHCWESSCKYSRRSDEPGREFFTVCTICYRTDCPNKSAPHEVKICEVCHSKVDYED